jgi:hypothetical protein
MSSMMNCTNVLEVGHSLTASAMNAYADSYDTIRQVFRNVGFIAPYGMFLRSRRCRMPDGFGVDSCLW